MISVQNHPQRLSGNNILVILFLGILFSGCGILSSGNKNPEVISNNNKVKEVPTEVDTVEWKSTDEKKYPPITDIVDEEEVKKEGDGFYSVYNLSCFIPLQANRLNPQVMSESDLNNLNYIQYYAGMKLAADQLSQEGVNINLNVYDSGFETEKVKQIVENQLPMNTNIVLAPFKKDALSYLAEMGKEKKVPVISPWLSSKSVTKNNPYYVQLRPFLTEYYRKITDHALDTYNPEQIFLLSRNNAKEIRRFKVFQQRANELLNQPNPLKTYTLDEVQLTGEDPVFEAQLNVSDTVVFIIPNYSNKDMQFVYNIIRRLHVERAEKNIIIYTMPLVKDMDQISFDYWNDLQIRICLFRFVDEADSEVKRFASKYYREYHDFPSIDAYEGYDNMMYIGRQLRENGVYFYQDKKAAEELEDSYLTTKYRLEPVYSNSSDKLSDIQYYENRHLMIVQYITDRFMNISK